MRRQKENDVPFYQDNKLAETLSRLQIGDTIPPELYEVVAEILCLCGRYGPHEGKTQKNPAYCRQMTDAVMVTEGTEEPGRRNVVMDRTKGRGERIPDEQAADGNSV